MSRVLFVLICLIWGSSFILMKKAGLAFGPLGVGAWRVLAGGLTLAVLWWMVGKRWPMDRGHVVPLLLLAAGGYAVPYVVQPYLVGRHGSAFVGMLVSLVPLLTIAVSVPMLSVVPTWRQVVGVVGGLGFMMVLFGDGLRREVGVWEVGLAVAIPLAYAVSNTYVKKRFAGVSPLALSMAAMLLSAGMLVPVALGREGVVVGEDFGLAMVSLVVLGVVATGLAMYMFYRLIHDHGPLYAGMVAYAIPAVAVMWGWLDGERLSWVQVGALAGIFAMVWLVQHPGKRRRVEEGVVVEGVVEEAMVEPSVAAEEEGAG
jgi:drug/metabolite transporter (DMT)-like permease